MTNIGGNDWDILHILHWPEQRPILKLTFQFYAIVKFVAVSDIGVATRFS